MGYVCPVCEDPQADATHLANHLAFTAMLGDDDHEAWLDEHAPGWGDMGPADLAEQVVDRAAETEYPQVFEDTTDGADHSHDHDHGHDHDRRQRGAATDVASDVPGGVADVDEVLDADDGERDPAEVLAEARDLTRQRRANASDGAADGDDGTDDGDGGDAEDDADGADGTD